MSPLRRRILRRSSRPHVADGPAWIYAGVRPVPLLVSPLLVSSPRTGPPHHAALSRADDARRGALRGGAFEQRCRASLQTDRRHRAHRALASAATDQPFFVRRLLSSFLS